MLTLWLRKLVLGAAFLVMPLQGIAATLSVLLCHGDTQAHAAHVTGGTDHHGMQHHDGQHGGHPDDNGPGGNSAFHLCCNLTVSVAPTLTVQAVLPDFGVRSLLADRVPSFFVPEQPHRPPLV